MSAPPNILFLQTDQMAAQALRLYGHPATNTPNIDRLAAGGVVFDSCYCNFPLCAPSRFSMMSGQLASRIGAYDNGAEFPAEVPTFAHYLRALGYRTCLAGKMHFIGPDQLHGFDERLTSDIYPGSFVWSPDWEARGQRDTNGPMLVERAGRCEGSVQIDYDEQVAERACAWLDDHAAAGRTDPFLLAVSFTHPHDPYYCTEPYWSLYEDADIPLPEVRTSDDPHIARLKRQYGMTDCDFSDDQIRIARRGYYGAISYIDAKIGVVLDRLQALGLAENTVVVLTSDHGDMLGEHGVWMKKVFYEGSVKVPFVVSAPGRIPARRIAEPVSLVDLLPTLVGFANRHVEEPVDFAEPLDGIDLSRILSGGTERPPNRTVASELTCEGTPGVQILLRRGALKFFWSAIDPPRLYDLSTNPAETRNRAGDPAYAGAEASFRREIEDGWDVPALDAAIRTSQRRRRLIQRAHLAAGTPPDWDHVDGAAPDARWMRGQTSYNDWAYGSVEGADE